MNRRQVLFGASAAALAFGGFVPMPSSAGPVRMSVIFAPFETGIRGTYTLNGSVTLIGTITPVAPGPSNGQLPALAVQEPVVQQPVASIEPAKPTPAPAQMAAPARPPMMSIVSVPRGSAARAARFAD